MDEHKEELATLETLDSGAVYTLALKTHVGMSVDTWRYFAGWCDKIHGSTIPINNARPNHNLTITKREPIGLVMHSDGKNLTMCLTGMRDINLSFLWKLLY